MIAGMLTADPDVCRRRHRPALFNVLTG